MEKPQLAELTAQVVSAFLMNNTIPPAEVGDLVRATGLALDKLGEPDEVEAVPLAPAVSIRASVKPDHIVCLEDGRKMKMLKRHLRTAYDMSPDEYRTRWNLPADYPMVAPNYAEKRRELAVKIGLGRKPGQRRGRARKAA